MTHFDRINDDSAEWEVFEVTPTHRRSRLWLDDKQYIVRTEHLETEALLSQNRELYKDSEGKRWGDGRIAADIPDHVFFREIAPRLRDGDSEYLKWFLNHEDNLKYRTFKGRL